MPQVYHHTPDVQTHAEATGHSRETMKEALLANNALRFEALAVKEFGPAAGIFARQLLFWDGRGHDPDGWVYKSQPEWERETGLTRRSQDTARKRLKGTGKSNGQPVLEEKQDLGPDGRLRLFYRLDLEALMDRLSDGLQPPAEEEEPEPSTRTSPCTPRRTGSLHTLASSDTARLRVPTNQKSTQESTQETSPPGGESTPDRPGDSQEPEGDDIPFEDDSSSSPARGEESSATTSTVTAERGSEGGLIKDAVAALVGGMKRRGFDLDRREIGRYAGELGELVRDEELEPGELERVIGRMIERRHACRLTPWAALSDIRHDRDHGAPEIDLGRAPEPVEDTLDPVEPAEPVDREKVREIVADPFTAAYGHALDYLDGGFTNRQTVEAVAATLGTTANEALSDAVEEVLGELRAAV